MGAIQAAHERFLGNKYFGSLDGLRAISIIAVVWHHSSFHGAGLLGHGYYGVQLFFAISGFLITTLLLREQDRAGRISLKNFYIRRTLRIFPAYYAVIALYTVVVVLMDHTPAGSKFLSNLPYFATYTSNWFVVKYDWFRHHERIVFYFAWSLATEEQFYLFWPSIVRFARVRYLPVAVMVLLLVLEEGTRWALGVGWFTVDPLVVRIVLSIAPPICLGCLAAYLLHWAAGFRLAHRIAGQLWSAPLAMGSLVFLLSLDDTYPPLAIIFAMAYLVVACAIRPDHLLRGFLEHSWLRHVGTVSYGVYLLHMLAINVVHRILGEDAGGGTVFALSLPLTIVGATISYRFFEQRFLALKDRFTSSAPRFARTVTGFPAVLPPQGD
jgi:peptidoglycan/LPS O-acetylase OafA/YrhL